MTLWKTGFFEIGWDFNFFLITQLRALLAYKFVGGLLLCWRNLYFWYMAKRACVSLEVHSVFPLELLFCFSLYDLCRIYTHWWCFFMFHTGFYEALLSYEHHATERTQQNKCVMLVGGQQQAFSQQSLKRHSRNRWGFFFVVSVAPVVLGYFHTLKLTVEHRSRY